MITITPHYEKFKVKISHPGTGVRGFSVYVKGLEAVFTVMRHYYGKLHDEGDCALCKKGE